MADDGRGLPAYPGAPAGWSGGREGSGLRWAWKPLGLWVLSKSTSRPGQGLSRQRAGHPPSKAWPLRFGAHGALHLPRASSTPCFHPHRKSLTYFNHVPGATLQEVTFNLPEVRTIFFRSFHKVLEGSGGPRLASPAQLPRSWGRAPAVGTLQDKLAVSQPQAVPSQQLHPPLCSLCWNFLRESQWPMWASAREVPSAPGAPVWICVREHPNPLLCVLGVPRRGLQLGALCPFYRGGTSERVRDLGQSQDPVPR